MRMINSNPSFVNRDVRSQEQVVEREGEGKDVESGPEKDEIDEVLRTVAYATSSPPDVRKLTQVIEKGCGASEPGVQALHV